MIILAQDPSFTHLSYSLKEDNNIYMNTINLSLGENIGFDKIFNSIMYIWDEYKKSLDAIGVGSKIKIDKLISEIPPPVGNFSAGLYALDTFIIYKLISTYTSINEVYIVSPSYLGTIHGTSKYKKSDSTKLAKYFIEEVFNNNYNIIIPDSVSKTGRKTKGKLNNDKAESFLFLLRLMCKFNIDDKENMIKSEMSGLGYEAEKLLFKRNQ